MLEGEREWMTAVAANLADDNVKLVYADWLQEHNDDRAEFLRKFVATSRTMDANTIPKPKKSYSEEWLELIGFRLIERIAQRFSRIESTGHAARAASTTIYDAEQTAQETCDWS